MKYSQQKMYILEFDLLYNTIFTLITGKGLLVQYLQKASLFIEYKLIVTIKHFKVMNLRRIFEIINNFS